VLFSAIDRDNEAMCKHLLDLGLDIEVKDETGTTPLMQAASLDATKTLELLLAAGADVEVRTIHKRNAMYYAESADAVRRLLKAGAFSVDWLFYNKRRILKLNPRQSMSELISCTKADWDAGRERKFGTCNAQDMTSPYTVAMIRSFAIPENARTMLAGSRQDALNEVTGPIWNAHRAGQSLTVLLDGPIVEIGGQYSDSLDPDFCIYNDVFVFYSDSQIKVYGYPEDIFPPIAFHSATQIGRGADSSIIIIGGLGYKEGRKKGKTPVYRLRVRDWSIHPVPSVGDCPNWLHQHKARRVSDTEIEVCEGMVLSANLISKPDKNRYIFNLTTGRWRRI
jgi:hypothetical protein